METIIVGAALVAVNAVAAFLVVRLVKSLISERALLMVKVDGLIYALRNINGEYKGWSQSFSDKFDEYLTQKDAEQKFKYYN